MRGTACANWWRPGAVMVSGIMARMRNAALYFRATDPVVIMLAVRMTNACSLARLSLRAEDVFPYRRLPRARRDAGGRGAPRDLEEAGLRNWKRCATRAAFWPFPLSSLMPYRRGVLNDYRARRRSRMGWFSRGGSAVDDRWAASFDGAELPRSTSRSPARSPLPGHRRRADIQRLTRRRRQPERMDLCHHRSWADIPHSSLPLANCARRCRSAPTARRPEDQLAQIAPLRRKFRLHERELSADDDEFRLIHCRCAPSPPPPMMMAAVRCSLPGWARPLLWTSWRRLWPPGGGPLSVSIRNATTSKPHYLRARISWRRIPLAP